MKTRLFPNRIAAILAAEAESVARGYDAETARKFSAAFAVRRFQSDRDEWEAWYIHHMVPGPSQGTRKVYRRPLMA
jgi:hypothetical protein